MHKKFVTLVILGGRERLDSKAVNHKGGNEFSPAISWNLLNF